MWVVLIILSVLILLLIGFLVTPIVLYIDSDEQRYEVRQLPMIRFFVDANTLRPRLTILGVPVPLPISKKKKERDTKEEKVGPKKREKGGGLFRKSFAAWRFLIQEILNSFKIRRCVLLLDTDDVVLNAKLTPLFVFASRGPFQVQTNFEGRVYFHLDVLNRPVSLLWVFIKFLTKK
jgi:hypothetical protein